MLLLSLFTECTAYVGLERSKLIDIDTNVLMSLGQKTGASIGSANRTCRYAQCFLGHGWAVKLAASN